jgi:glucose-6-phosphate 1-epimerase
MSFEYSPPAYEIKMGSGGLRARIDRQGGYVQTLSRADGTPILYGAITPDGKRRATHVCVPNFGPDARGELHQHGFGRETVWTQEVMSEEDDATQLRLTHTVDVGEYTGLHMGLDYTITSDSFTMSLNCQNNSDQPLRLAPGFHPYFALPTGVETVTVDGRSYRIDELAEAKFQHTETGHVAVEFGQDQGSLRLETNLRELALWSGDSSRYVCIEPTYSGASFAATTTPPAEELLAPGEDCHYYVTILTS